MAQSKRISDLENAETLGISDLFEISQFVEEGVYISKKIGASFLAADILERFMLGSLDTTQKTIVGAINELLTPTIETVGELRIERVGKTVNIYGYLSSLSSSASINLGSTSFKSSATYAILPLFNSAAPYTPIGSLWVRDTGTITLYKNASATSGYVSGSYICQ